MKQYFYIIYQIRNKENNKIYVGMHKTTYIEDGYFGSGRWIKAAVRKYGQDKFEKEILHVYSSFNEMIKKEAEIVDEDFCKRCDTYNIKVGGRGGFEYINKNNINNSNKDFKSIYKNLSDLLRGVPKPLHAIKMRESYQKGRKPAGCSLMTSEMNKRSRSPEAILKKKATMAGKRKGSENSQFNTMWITNDIDNKKIKKDQPIPLGWRKGRRLLRVP